MITAVSKMNGNDSNVQMTLQTGLYHHMECVQTLKQPRQSPFQNFTG